MPFTTLEANVGGGMYLEVLVGVSKGRQDAMERAGFPVPPAVQLRALVDTGASVSAVDHRVLEKLGLHPVGTINISTTSSGSAGQDMLEFDIGLNVISKAGERPLMRSFMPVIATDLESFGFSMLLGMDVLSSCLLVCDGKEGRFTLAY